MFKPKTLAEAFSLAKLQEIIMFVIKDQFKPVTKTPIQEHYSTLPLLIAPWLCHHIQNRILKGDYFLTLL